MDRRRWPQHSSQPIRGMSNEADSIFGLAPSSIQRTLVELGAMGGHASGVPVLEPVQTSPRSSRIVLRILPILVAGAVSASAASDPELAFSPEQRAYWAFQPLVRPTPSPTADPAWVRNPVDAFVLAGLAAERLSPAPPAAKATLVRRLYLDLTGLLPSPPEVAAFVADNSPTAYQRLIERLLASPHYGERWGRHWLDLARFAESTGFEQDVTRPNAWRYRDYVIDAFNADKPYDRFVQEQIAGDELWPDLPDARIATAFNRNYAEEPNQKDLLLARQETLHDITSVVGSTFLGLTFECARCHDHKFDPIPQRDYYRLQAFFAAVNHDDSIPVVRAAQYNEYQGRLAIWEEKTAAIWQEMYELLEPQRKFTREQLLHRYPDYVIEAIKTPADRRDPNQEWMASLLERKFCGTCPFEPKPYMNPRFRNGAGKLKGDDKQRFEELEAELASFEHLQPDDVPRGTGIFDVSPNPPATHVLGGGLYTNPGQEVQPGFLSILQPGPASIRPPPDGRSTGRRTALAKWLTDPANPLVARVMVNRIWHYHFGRGIVATPSDFGTMGELPTHPELLDWLAAEFVDSGWSVKHVHRLILGSSTYRQAAKSSGKATPSAGPGVSASAAERARRTDPFNKLLWKFPTRRLDGEVVRDAALSAAGLLNTRLGGPSVFPPLPDGVPSPTGGWKTTQSSAEHRRRSVYIFVRRNTPYPMLATFDFPDTHESCGRRNRTTTAPQALALLNGQEPSEWARAFAGRVLSLAGSDPMKQVDVSYSLAYARVPDPREKDLALTFLDHQARIVSDRPEGVEPAAVPDVLPSGVSSQHAAALVDYCLMLLNSNEFVYSL